MPEKIPIKLEYIIRSSVPVLFNMISTPGGLSRWFADDVNIKNNMFFFIWNGSEDSARLIEKKMNKHIRLQWDDDAGSDCYFEFRLKTQPLTGDVALVITDYCEPEEEEETNRLWEAQISKLKQVLGC